ncbi:NrfD/PsrC family molybdoenzyme membrane anchor subunit [Blastochloris sulfoviridis]|uniref:Molybdopterin oxidoreductase n=1 Tax=Blastochloris sulfoviridis TaxID=50712 RepID=A0A5M6I2I3_9HYPH|nr:NrfD/PsrC family molybdoenzyme membrane anchor subunit [Blastochloris sulfoviridis]KAA5602414.1 molybdopterin oxidoreductase [Blastochloris sulfoviridis]
MAKLAFQTLDDHSTPFWALIAFHVALVAAGLGAALYMEENGHIVTGMNNQVVWGLPHVFAVFLIVAASGALNVASVSSVFNRLAYKPYARLSGLLAIALLIGGLAVLVLDLGRPDRLLVAMTTYNFKSIFAWNIYLYSGFVVIVAAYLFSMMDRQAAKSAAFGKAMGWLAFGWRLALTTGTGSIFGFLIAREAYDAAILAPLFIAASFLYGLAFTVLVLLTMSRETRDELMPEEMLGKFRGLLAIFALAVLYFTAVQHVTKLYSAAHQGVELFLLRDGGVFPLVFWLGQIGIGTVLPLALLAFAPRGTKGRLAIELASALFLIGGLAQLYVIIIGGQAFPLALFPGMEVSSPALDGEVGRYVPALPELLLGASGVSMAMLIVALALRLMPFLPKAPAGEVSANAATAQGLGASDPMPSGRTL